MKMMMLICVRPWHLAGARTGQNSWAMSMASSCPVSGITALPAGMMLVLNSAVTQSISTELSTIRCFVTRVLDSGAMQIITLFPCIRCTEHALPVVTLGVCHLEELFLTRLTDMNLQVVHQMPTQKMQMMMTCAKLWPSACTLMQQSNSMVQDSSSTSSSRSLHAC